MSRPSEIARLSAFYDTLLRLQPSTFNPLFVNIGERDKDVCDPFGTSSRRKFSELSSGSDHQPGKEEGGTRVVASDNTFDVKAPVVVAPPPSPFVALVHACMHAWVRISNMDF